MENMRSQNDNDDCVEINEKDTNIWPDANENVFIELMIEEVKKRNLTTSTFSKTGWKNIIQGLKERVGREYTHDQLKNKYHNLRARHRKFATLIKETGIGYNSQTGQVNATEEVWETLKKVHSLATRFKRKGCKEFNELCLIFGGTTATGNNNHASTKSPSDSEDETRETKTRKFNLKDGEDYESELDADEDERSTKKNKHKSKACSPKKKKVKRSYSHVLEEALLNIGEESKRKNDLLEKKIKETSERNNKFDGNPKENEDVDVMADCLTALDQLKLEGIAYGKAVNALLDSALCRKVFLRMPDERKKDWVLAL